MDSESKSQVKESSVSVPVENRFGSVLKPLVAFLCQDTVSSDMLLWTQRCAAHPAHRPSLVGNFCMDGAHPPTNYAIKSIVKCIIIALVIKKFNSRLKIRSKMSENYFFPFNVATY
jgi:hypothetical protein